MKIAILTSGILPVPAVRGGAVENHIDFYLKRTLLDKGDARELAHIAADRGITAIVSVLMDYAESDRYTQIDGDRSVIKDDNTLDLDF